MSDTQFSSLSPNSSYDLDIGNRYSEDYDYNDQETLSITSNKSVRNLEDFDAESEEKPDPFLSDFIKEECDEISKVVFSDNSIESFDVNLSFNSPITEYGYDGFLFGLDNVSLYPMDTNFISYWNPFSYQRQFSNKRAFSPIESVELTELPLPTKQRKVEVSSHVRCDEWINKFTVKASGTLDRRKTKHHKVLDEYDSELQIENIEQDQKVDRAEEKISISENIPLIISSQNNDTPVTISIYPAKSPSTHSVSHVIRRPFVHCNTDSSMNTANNSCHHKTHIKSYPQPQKSPHAHTPINTSPTTGSSKSLSDIVEMPRIPAPLRMGRRVSRRGHRLSLWQFLMCLLDSYKYREHSTGIKWLNRKHGVFHIIDSKQVATLWGEYKERRDKMTYDSLARSLRHYYKKNLMAKINNRRLVYQIAQECIQWSTETFLKIVKERESL